MTDGVTIDSATGLPYQDLHGFRVFLRRESDFMTNNVINWACNDVYFKYYQPTNGDVVVDIGAGYGHEAIFLLARAPLIKYFGIEVQPSVYECLANTFRTVSDRCKAIPFAISEQNNLYISSSADYTGVTSLEDGYIEVPTMTWQAMRTRYSIDQIDLLKINIEGGERFVLPLLGDMQNIRRVIISAHDFRADRGESEHYRTREFVLEYLCKQGYSVRSVEEQGWLTNWLYGERQ
jgi:FkbM family methyltransferase